MLAGVKTISALMDSGVDCRIAVADCTALPFVCSCRWLCRAQGYPEGHEPACGSSAAQLCYPTRHGQHKQQYHMVYHRLSGDSRDGEEGAPHYAGWWNQSAYWDPIYASQYLCLYMPEAWGIWHLQQTAEPRHPSCAPAALTCWVWRALGIDMYLYAPCLSMCTWNTLRRSAPVEA